MIPSIPGTLAGQITPVSPLKAPSEPADAQELFSDLLRKAIQRVETSGADASTAAERFLSGDSADIHSAALATQRAALQFEYVLQVRNKIVQAYQEIMRMQL